MADGLEDVQNRLSLWLQTHRGNVLFQDFVLATLGVYDYLDPHVILVVPAATSVAGMANFVAALPALPGGPLGCTKPHGGRHVDGGGSLSCPAGPSRGSPCWSSVSCGWRCWAQGSNRILLNGTWSNLCDLSEVPRMCVYVRLQSMKK